MQFTKTTNRNSGKTRYFIDGKRVSRDRYDTEKHGRTLNSFLTVFTPTHTRQHHAG
jgi:hypothetical protein